ncbi:hypothetical protein [Ammoniphilus sp. CFH 90114]|uniref:hypothetical protein n=1 Tax=Ammoniphilus sp. CFH 90114 TaxID=2493665 RepID=UPI00100ED139|nr:hypothetical protein [Ammoniphilus sp. CFH 90114]RXT07827.1 hypothetical protein EIZ39_10380 [Ammoniphilus sp. CFH 90114]
MLNEKVAKKIFLWTLGLFILISFLLSYLAGDLKVMGNDQYWTAMSVLIGALVVSGIPWLLVMEAANRRVVLIGLGLTSAFYLLKMVFT